jgi:hypothetical protein
MTLSLPLLRHQLKVKLTGLVPRESLAPVPAA